MAPKQAVAAKSDDGSLQLSSESHVHAALQEADQIREEIRDLEEALLETDIGVAIRNCRAELNKIEGSIEAYILENYQAGEGYEDARWKLTKVVGHTRTWNVEKLRALVPRGMFKNLTHTVVVPAKIDEYVRAKKIELDDIDAAFEEKPNKPYVKVTERNVSTGDDQTAELAAKLGL